MHYVLGFILVLALGLMGCSGGEGVACADNVCPCSEAGIRAAIAEGGGPFTFDCDYPDRIVTEAEIVIDKDVILDGEGDPLHDVPLLTLTVDGNYDRRVFSISEGVTAELVGLTVANGAVIGLGQTGGGIYNAGTLTLTNAWVSDNSSATDGGGISCSSGATLTLKDSLVSGNTASSSGGGIRCDSVTLTDSLVSGNTAGRSGGGIRGAYVLTNSRVLGNHGGESGGGLHGSGTLTDSTVSGNTATFSGGGIVAYGPTTVLRNTTVSLNVAARGEGGGILGFYPHPKGSTKQIPLEPVLVLTNSTVSGNSAAATGGGISIDGSESRGILVHGTVSANNATDGSGITTGIGLRGAYLEVVNSLVDGQCHGDGDIVSNGYNIESPGDTCGFDLTGDQPGVTAEQLKLFSLADNGGLTRTHALGKNSVAIDPIPEAQCTDATGEPLTNDQRGVTRPQGAACDVGAFEQEVGEACVANEFECASAQIDPIEEMCEVIVPDQPNACDGTESIANPTSCAAPGNAVIHKLTQMQVAADCNVGFNVDGCDGQTCSTPIAGPGFDGTDGVDNGLLAAGLAFASEPTSPCTRPLRELNQAFHDAICLGLIDVEIAVRAAQSEGCALVTVWAGGAPGDSVPMNLSDDGCLSGTLGRFPLSLGDVQGRIENAIVRMTVSAAGLTEGTLGGTSGASLAAEMLDVMCIEGAGAVAVSLFDINADLSGNSVFSCDALSLALEIAGSAQPAR